MTRDNSESADLVIIGSGPAGLTAATEASSLGLSVLLLDEQEEPGGQIYRGIETAHPKTARLLGPDYQRGAALASAFRASASGYRPGASVWRVDADGTIAYSRDGQAHIVRGKRILVATGAQERPVPIPGWTLPGVMSAGGAQVLLKSAGVVPSGRIIVAGNGPLLLLIAQQLITAGANVAAILETTEFSDYLAAASSLPRAMQAGDYLAKGQRMRHDINAAGIPQYSGVSHLAASGDEKFKQISFESGGMRHTLSADTLLLHAGVVPNTQITRQLDCDHEWVADQRYWQPVLDSWGTTSCDTVAVAGDGGSIIGAEASAIAGRLAALDTARRLGIFNLAERDQRAAPLRGDLARHLAIRPLLDTLFRPDPAFCVPPDDETIVCRCEEVTAGDIRIAVREGAMGPNQLKVFTRCGMGPCQGRMCGLTVSEIIAAARGATLAETGYYRIRPPIKPLTLGELAALDDKFPTE